MMAGRKQRTLYIDEVAYPEGGSIGMTICPGQHRPWAMSGPMRRDLDVDITVIRNWGASVVVTLMEEHELAQFRSGNIGKVVRSAGMQWIHLPIVDMDIPDEHFEFAWRSSGPELHEHLRSNRKILVHCLGGLGRTGMVSARLLIEAGVPPTYAMEQVRAARSGAIQTPEQEMYVLQCRARDTEPGNPIAR